MRKLIWLLPVLAVIGTGCKKWELKTTPGGVGAATQKGRCIIDEKLVEPPYAEPVWNDPKAVASMPGDGLIRINGIVASPVISDRATADSWIAGVKASLAKDVLLVLKSAESTQRELEVGMFDKAKEILASAKTDDEKMGELNVLFRGAVNPRVFLDKNR